MQEIDVILPFHRDDLLLQYAVDSVCRSEGVKPKLLLIDDRKNKSLLNLKIPPNIEFEIFPNSDESGYGNALKASFKHLTHHYVGLMNSDDLVSRYRFKEQIDSLGDCDLSIAKILSISQKGIHRSLTGSVTCGEYSSDFLMLGAYGANATWVMKKEWWEKQELDNKQFLDWRIALKSFPNSRISYVNRPLYYYRQHNSQVDYSTVPTNELFELYEDWKSYLLAKNFPEPPLGVFLFFALPWKRITVTNVDEIVEWSILFNTFAAAQNRDVQANFLKLLERRFAIGVTVPNISILQRIKLLTRSDKQMPSMLIDFLYNSFIGLKKNQSQEFLNMTRLKK